MVLDTVRSLSQLEYEGEFEILVVIDGSTDGTAAALAQLECPVPLRVVEQENRGLAAARNRGAAGASTEIVLFLDDDMTCAPDLLQEHWRAYREGADAVAGDFTEDVGAGGGVAPTGAERRNIQQHAGSLTPFEIFGGHLSVRRSAFEKVGGFDEAFTRDGRYGYEDFDFGHRLMEDFVVRRNPAAICHHRKLVSPREYIFRGRASANAEVHFLAKHPELRGALRRRMGGSEISDRLRILSSVPLLPRMFAEFAAAVSWIGSRTPFRSSRKLAWLRHAGYAVTYWSTVRRNGEFPES
jgi:glycosyltransferase involved in cell wall biosynthesis